MNPLRKEVMFNILGKVITFVGTFVVLCIIAAILGLAKKGWNALQNEEVETDPTQ